MSPIKTLVRERLYSLANELDWAHLSISRKALYYEQWAASPEIGGLLEQVMAKEKVRVYLKDTVMRGYSRQRREDVLTFTSRLGLLDGPHEVLEKPPAVWVHPGKLYTVTRAVDWKIALLSAFERNVALGPCHTNIVFLDEHADQRFVEPAYRLMVESAGKRLGVTVQWLD